ncbi:ABC transporter permease [Roseomonas sp. NAR14]|uniref:ABC transporter permease n=1 Tax=Roseomonas acroporae TaxID=2937791 RepID=A0A9X1Y8F3_9PROT|nr:ABC transporter permease [Roseomonas acroporae]MCK8785433.1 ABC transporter permease [Roseomonas acroporae]
MTAFLLRRLLQAAFVMLAMSVLVFLGVFAIGDPVEILVSPQADQAERARIIADLGLDRPLWEQYLHFLGNALRGDLGRSFAYNEPALRLILHRLPATLELAASAMLIALVIGLPLGLFAGLPPRTLPLRVIVLVAGLCFSLPALWLARVLLDQLPGGAGPAAAAALALLALGLPAGLAAGVLPRDLPARAIMAGSILGFSLPTFWVGLLLIMVFAVQLGWLPSTGRGATVAVLGVEWSFLTADGIAHLILPALNLALFNISLMVRLVRAGVRETMLTEFVKFARAKGLSPRRIVLVHVLKAIMIPVVTVLGLEFGQTVAFSVVTESVFAWPGVGKLIVDSIYQLDRPVIVAYLMLIVLLFILINLAVDLAYSLLDPRVRLGGRA